MACMDEVVEDIEVDEVDTEVAIEEVTRLHKITKIRIMITQITHNRIKIINLNKTTKQMTGIHHG